LNIYLPLRWRLTVWYSAIVLVSLSTFAGFAYYWVFNELYSNLDDSLDKISGTMYNIIDESAPESISNKTKNEFAQLLIKSADRFAFFRREEKSRFVGPLRPVELISKPEKRDIVWSAIFKHILLNPENYFIQIADTSKEIIWKSRNLELYDLPVDYDNYKPEKIIKYGSKLKIFDNVLLGTNHLRLLIYRDKHAIITIAYTVKEVKDTLKSLFTSLMLGVPFILLVSITGGIFLSKMSLRPVDKITKTAKEITAKNLSLKISVPPINDEIGRLAETLNEMILRLEKSFNQIRQFTSDASHELRTPLTILRGEIEIALNKDRTVEEYMEILNSALEEVMRLSRVVDSLLELSRADAGQTKMQLKIGNLSNLVSDITEDMEIIADDKDVKLFADIESDINIHYDDIRLHQAILNIIDNAVKYTQAGGKVVVSLKNREHYVEFKVSDSGIGMNEIELSHAFDRFYRVDKARSANIKGTGLGLSIVKWIVESHKGKMFIESQPDKGTNFTIMIPKQIV
jgi:heavy metal sensor kinase